MLKYPAIFHPEDSGFSIEFPDLPGCLSEGNNLEDALAMAEEALNGHIGCLIEMDRDVPDPSDIRGENIFYIPVEPEIAIPILLKKLRKLERLSQSDVARRINIAYQSYQRIENVKGFNASIKTLSRIAKALGKRLDINFV
jgi:antitoxin HicB